MFKHTHYQQGRQFSSLERFKYRSYKSQKVQLSFIVPLSVGTILTILFSIGITLPYEILIPIFMATFILGVFVIKVTQLSILPRLAITLYSLPFTPTIGYLFNKYHTWAFPNPVRAQYMWNHAIISQMVMVALIGLLGLTTGVLIKKYDPQNELRQKAIIDQEKLSYPKTLDIVMFTIVLIMSVMFSWIHAPSHTIFTDTYSSISSGLAKKVGLTSSALISYVLLLLLYLDTEREPRYSSQKKWKYGLILGTTLFIIVFFQLIRGDRESISLITAFVALYLTGSDVKSVTLSTTEAWKKIKKVVIPASIIVIIYLSIGSLRSEVSKTNLSSINLFESMQSGFRSATWNGILLSSLSMAGQYYDGQIEYLYGSTYTGYILSLPPGFVAQSIGWNRPIDSSGDPAATWFPKGATAGGIHAALVPFRNFGAPGVFIILMLYGVFISHIEIANSSRNYLRDRLIYAALVCYINRWFWYGDINIIRSLMIAFLVYIMYQFLTGFSCFIKGNSRKHLIKRLFTNRL